MVLLTPHLSISLLWCEQCRFLRKTTVDKNKKIAYNICVVLFGGAMVSTGILKYDKRGEPGNLVNCLNLKNKRQQ